MSDFDTDWVEGVDVVVRKPYDRPRMMTYRLDHLADYEHNEMLILDDDCIVKGDVTHVFNDLFDVSLTRRTEPAHFDGVNMTEHWPYNTGVMFSRSPAFWQRAAKVCHALPDQFQRWWGDQMAVAVTAQRGGYAVRDLDAKQYNWTPASSDDTSSALIWHYKGQRKEWI